MKKYFTLTGLAVLLAVVFSLTVIAQDQPPLPDAVVAAVQAMFPGAAIDESKQEEEDGVMLYEVEIEQNGQELELTITPEGTVVEQEQEITVQELPEAAQQAVAGAEIEEVSKEINYYRIKDKQIEKLAAPEVCYEATIEKDGKTTEIKFAADGTVVKEEAGDDEDADDKDDDKDDDDEDDD